MKQLTPPPFSDELQHKINLFLELQTPISIGSLSFASPLLMAPLSGITDTPFRLFMQDLGAGGSVTELISSNGFHHRNEKTMKMIHPHPQERHVGVQFFGEHPEHMAEAAQYAESIGVTFVDINLGCPVKKVVSKGAGSALLKELEELENYLRIIKNGITIPMTIKIRTGWNLSSRNADEVLRLAKNLGINHVALHGRTREQQYAGSADWEYIENLAQQKIIPLIGNGDLHTPFHVREKLKKTSCHALMLGRGPLRHPFLFLEGLDVNGKLDSIFFSPADFFEAILRYHYYLSELVDREHLHLLQLKKIIVWCAAGYPNATPFRGSLFGIKSINEILKYTGDFFNNLEKLPKKFDTTAPFLQGGHG